MKTMRIKPNYFPLTQQKYCCFPCCIQWILLRRGLKLISQDKIAKEVGLVIPPEDQRLFNEKMKTAKKIPKGKTTYGTWKVDVPKLLNKFNIPLKMRSYYPSKIATVKKFIIDNLQKGNDIIVSFNVGPYSRPKNSVNYIHSCVIDSIRAQGKKTIVTLGDPSYSHRKFFDIDLKILLEGMSNKYYSREKSFKVFFNKSESKNTKFQKTL